MKVTLNEIRENFKNLLEEKKSREEISDWAAARIKAGEKNDLEYEPAKEEARIWRSIEYLSGVDLIDVDGSYLHSKKNFIDFIEQIKL
jgi:hypothetical protein